MGTPSHCAGGRHNASPRLDETARSRDCNSLTAEPPRFNVSRRTLGRQLGAEGLTVAIVLGVFDSRCCACWGQSRIFCVRQLHDTRLRRCSAGGTLASAGADYGFMSGDSNSTVLGVEIHLIQALTETLFIVIDRAGGTIG
jgi:hypothetical protein